MTSLLQKLRDDLKQAMKDNDETRRSALRLLFSVIHNKEIEKKTKTKDSLLTDEEILDCIRAEARKRKEAILVYEKGNRGDLVSKEKGELEALQAYLPPEATEEEILRAVDAACAVVRPQGAKDFGRTMGEAMKTLRGRAEAERVSILIKKKIAG